GVTVAMVSEILRLDNHERREVANIVCTAAGDRGPTILSIGAETTRLAVAFAEQAQSAGATAVMAIPPLAVQALDRELEGYYVAILEAVDVPVVVQDASSYVGAPIPIDVLARLHYRFPDRLYFKPEAQPIGPRLSALLGATGGQARVYDGSGGVALIETFHRGIVGTMPGAEVCWAIVAMWRALGRGDEETAYRLSLPLSALLATQVGLDGYLAVEKHLLVKQKVFVSAGRRPPLGFELDDVTATHVDTLFDLLVAACERAGGAGPTVTSESVER
ncbi:MAG TPA: dihydrodipicolinate synthase family protein, partial [Acidimicrobiales bacterium]|nr:dihydrodipicolinate synthase family protein [Acidimicrobiales bacterium]